MSGSEPREYKEEEKRVKHAWIFDVDGVLTHPSEKRVTEPDLLPQLIKRLEVGEPVALNTGRSIDYMIAQVIRSLQAAVTDKKLFKNFLAVGEKGAITLGGADQGELKEWVDTTIAVPTFLQQEVRRIVEEQFSETMFFDTTKRTMISIEMCDGLELKVFQAAQLRLNEILAQLVAKHNLGEKYKLDPSRIATDIENKHVGKALGVRRIVEWLNKKKITPEQFVTFGDSRSDVPMAEELHRQGLPVEFVFVGGKDLLEGRTFDFPVTYTEGMCEEGTVEFLKHKQ